MTRILDNLGTVSDLFAIIEQHDTKVSEITLPLAALDVVAAEYPFRQGEKIKSIWGAKVTWVDNNRVIVAASKKDGGYSVQAQWGTDIEDLYQSTFAGGAGTVPATEPDYSNEVNVGTSHPRA